MSEQDKSPVVVMESPDDVEKKHHRWPFENNSKPWIRPIEVVKRER